MVGAGAQRGGKNLAEEEDEGDGDHLCLCLGRWVGGWIGWSWFGRVGVWWMGGWVSQVGRVGGRIIVSDVPIAHQEGTSWSRKMGRPSAAQALRRRRETRRRW